MDTASQPSPSSAWPGSILRQRSQSTPEIRTVLQAAMLLDVPVRLSLDAHDLADHEQARELLATGQMLPVGSVEFVRAAMAAGGLAEPENLTYPTALKPHLHRDISVMMAHQVRGPTFVKPTDTKSFTGFVFERSAHPASLSEHDAEQWRVFTSLPQETPVWAGKVVRFIAEWRYYVLGQTVLGFARYDEDGADDVPEVPSSFIDTLVADFAAGGQAPAAYALDVGILAGGQPALVEVNDAWATGYYGRSVAPKDYLKWLWMRWAEIARLDQPA